VDPARIYLGGHSTGGTLALLVSELADGFRAVFAFGPVSSPAYYGADALTYNPNTKAENTLRSPIDWLDGIKSPTFALEGTESGNHESLLEMRATTRNQRVKFFPVKGAGHFDILAPVNALLAKKIAALKGSEPFTLASWEPQKAYENQVRASQEGGDLQTLADLRRGGLELNGPQTVRHWLLTRKRADLVAAGAEAKKVGFDLAPIENKTSEDGQPYFVRFVSERITLTDLTAVFKGSRIVRGIAKRHSLQSDGWDVAR
jgi:pimeloyl-ACP methyl ester carboxylesterase